MRPFVLLATAVVFAVLSGCGGAADDRTELTAIGLESLDGIYIIDDTDSSENIVSLVPAGTDIGPSLRLDSRRPLRLRIGAVGDIDVENAQLVYEASLRSEALQGQAYLEMWCWFSDRGEYFSRGLDNPVSGTSDWAAHSTPFYLKAGENPDSVFLNVVVDGVGTVWVAGPRLLRMPL
ncbi:MAG: hypothetical protein RBT76_03455 [candidate division Zixibacteria bacterium]|jgi:hypothetical protein|nr:hypothetical protein [candidate division Zixibacteria bacterium]